MALTSPPSRGPIRIVSCSVERPIKAARGTIASADVMNTATLKPSSWAASEIGTKTSSQSSDGVASRFRKPLASAAAGP